MTGEQVFYYCACPRCDADNTRMTLPRVSPLGEYKLVNRQLEFIPAPGAWPVTYACYVCRSTHALAESAISKPIESNKLRSGATRGYALFEIAVVHAQRYDAEKPIYTVAGANTEDRDLRWLITETRHAPFENILVRKFDYEF